MILLDIAMNRCALRHRLESGNLSVRAMAQTAKLMTITIKEGSSGMLFATSEDEPTFFVSAVSSDDLWSAVSVAIEDMYLSRHMVEVTAIPTDSGDYAHRPWAIVPKSLLAQLAAGQRAAAEQR
jgi:hypothetical protein